jgi:hypothetical protein
MSDTGEEGCPTYDASGDVIETHEHKDDFKEW